MESRVEGLVKQLQGVTDKSVAVGFGVSRPEQAQEIVSWGAEGVIVGSALVKCLGEAESPEKGLAAMEQLARSLREVIPHY
jgi:tryptophan synthase alpha chain